MINHNTSNSFNSALLSLPTRTFLFPVDVQLPVYGTALPSARTAVGVNVGVSSFFFFSFFLNVSLISPV